MSATISSESRAAAPRAPAKRGGGAAPGGLALGQDNTRDARRMAAAILEVLAGARTPAEAAAALGVSLPRYYQVESRALRGLLSACEPRPRGPGRSVDRELAALRRDNQRLQRELGRHQALARAAQRTIGLPPPPPTPARKPGKRVRKRRVARALGAAARLQQHNADPVVPAEVASDQPGR
jgi:hypothetical protein